MKRSLSYGVLAADCAWLVLAFLAACELEHRLSPATQIMEWPKSVVPMGTMLVMWALVRSWVMPDGHDRECRLAGVISRTTITVALTIGGLLGMVLLSEQPRSARVLLWFAPLMIAGVVGIRWVVGAALGARLGSFRRAVILGDDRVAEELALKIAAHPETLWKVAGVLRRCNGDAVAGAAGETISTLKILDLLQRESVQTLVVALADPLVAEVRNLIAACREQGLAVYFVPQPYRLYVSRPRLLEVDGVPLLSVNDSAPRPATLLAKRVMDVVLGVPLAILVALPLCVAAAIIQRRSGEGFRRELRCGRGGRLFWMYRLNVDRDDPRLEGFENLLAQLSLTELPQLWNVIRGNMALVGPRPESPERVLNYSDWQRQRLKVPPGITGLAQVHGLRERHSSDEKARFDLQYILHWSLLSDIALLIETAWVLALRISRGAAEGVLRVAASSAALAPEETHVNRPQSRAR